MTNQSYLSLTSLSFPACLLTRWFKGFRMSMAEAASQVDQDPDVCGERKKAIKDIMDRRSKERLGRDEGWYKMAQNAIAWLRNKEFRVKGTIKKAVQDEGARNDYSKAVMDMGEKMQKGFMAGGFGGHRTGMPASVFKAIPLRG